MLSVTKILFIKIIFGFILNFTLAVLCPLFPRVIWKSQIVTGQVPQETGGDLPAGSLLESALRSSVRTRGLG